MCKMIAILADVFIDQTLQKALELKYIASYRLTNTQLLMYPHRSK